MADFPMPQDLNEKQIGDYVPKISTQKLRDLEKDIAKQVTDYSSYTKDPIQQIQAQLKLLTHRQMRDMCKAIANGKDIPAADLPDILDKFAYGD